MGNKQIKTDKVNNSNSSLLHGTYEQKHDEFNQNLERGWSGRSVASISSHQSTYSLSRPWSRVSRRRWKESTLTLPYECSKTAWPVSQLESLFLPEFPLQTSTNAAGIAIDNSGFEVLEEISKGSFGKVYKVSRREGSEDQVYALKVLSKSKIIKDNSVQQVKEEAQIQKICGHHPFIVNSLLHWQDRKQLYIVSDFVPGGELFGLLKAYHILPKVLVQLYVAQLAIVLDFLHNAGVIYRDLKPENVLLDALGDCQLTDFGLSKWLSYGSKTRTVCGTLQYLAPEVLAMDEYGHAVDWWSLGVVACLMLTGEYPIVSTESVENRPRKKVTLPASRTTPLDVPSRDLLLRLLEVDPSKRLRSLRTLQTIAFYKDYNFKHVIEKRYKPNDLLKSHFPDGPPNLPEESLEIENFDETMVTFL